MKVYLGIDPGITRVGIAAVTEFNDIIHLDAIDDDAEVKQKRLDAPRLASITKRTQHSIRNAALPNTTTVALEQPFVGQFKTRFGVPTTNQGALKTYGVFVILMDVFYEHQECGRIEKLLTVPPPSLKKFLEARSKEQIAAVVKERWGFEHESHDVIDAFALAQYARAQEGKE